MIKPLLKVFGLNLFVGMLVIIFMILSYYFMFSFLFSEQELNFFIILPFPILFSFAFAFGLCSIAPIETKAKNLIKSFLTNLLVGMIVMILSLTIYILLFGTDSDEWNSIIVLFISIFISFSFALSLSLYSVIRKQILTIIKDKWFILILFFSIPPVYTRVMGIMENLFFILRIDISDSGVFIVASIFLSGILFYTLVLFLYFQLRKYLFLFFSKKNR